MTPGSGLQSFEGLFSCLLGGWCLFTSGNEISARLVWAFTHSLRAWFQGENLGDRRDPRGNHIALHDSVVEVICPSVCCGASYKDQPGFRVHLIQLAISWTLCGTGNMTLVIFEKHNLSQWTEEVDSTQKLIYKHNLILSQTCPSCYRLYIPVYLDCTGIKSTDYLEKSRYFQDIILKNFSNMSWNSHMSTFARRVSSVPFYLFIYLFLAVLGLSLQPVGYLIFFAAHGIFGMWDLIPWAGMEPGSPALGAWCLEALSFSFLNLPCSPHFPCSPLTLSLGCFPCILAYVIMCPFLTDVEFMILSVEDVAAPSRTTYGNYQKKSDLKQS